ncbi:MAG: hypothetical protein AAF721_34300 [Myxococcota bacterium]
MPLGSLTVPQVLRLSMIAVMLAGSGCARRSDGHVNRPTSAIDIEAELSRNEVALRDAGIVVPPPPAAEPAPIVMTPPSDDPEPEPPRADPPQPFPEPLPEPSPPPPAPASTDYDDAPELSSRRDERNYAVDAEMEEPAKGRRRRRSRRRRAERTTRAERRASSSRCDRVCDLAEATCGLAGHICSLAEKHPDDARYLEACVRAERQCDAADQACQACESN